MDNFKKEFRVGLIVFGVIGVVFAGFIWVAKGQVSSLSSRIAGVQGLISQQRTISSQLIELREDKDLAEKYERVMDVLVPTEKQIFDLKKWIENQAKTHGVEVVFDFAGNKTDPMESSLGNYPFSIKISGNVFDAASFISFLENQSPQFLMSFEDLSAGTNQSGSGQVALKGKVYFKANE